MPRHFCRLAALVLPFLAASCFGGAVLRENRRVMASFNFEKSVRVIHGGNPGPNPSGREIQSSWGQPDRTASESRDTVWTYKTRTGSVGIVPIYFLPIPLLVPKDNGIDFYFRDHASRPYQAIERTTGTAGGYYDSVSETVDTLGD